MDPRGTSSQDSVSRRLFAIIPAAGLARRMGRPKLLMPLGGRTVITRLLDLLDRPDMTERVVVMRRADDALYDEVSRSGATIVRPETDPPDMRASVSHAIAETERLFRPRADDGWMLLPADHPMLEPRVLDRLIERWQTGDSNILVPRHRSRRGHPTFFRWKLVEEIPAILADQGLNVLLERHASEIDEIEIDDPAVVTDLDTPEDYEALKRRWANE